jgi:hypothetical protein
MGDARLAAAVRESRLIRGVGALAAALLPDERPLRNAWISGTVGRQIGPRLSPLEMADAAGVADDSWLLRAIDRSCKRIVAASRTSRAWRWCAGTLAAVTTAAVTTAAVTTAGATVAAVGWIMLSAAVTRLAVLAWAGSLGPAGGGIGWVAVMAAALICIARPSAVAGALAYGSRRD